MATITVHPKSEQQASLFEQLAIALNVPFERKEQDAYDPEFVAKILEGSKEVADGKGTKIRLEDLWK
ncbi:MAG: DUF2683 family protein [Mucilaginibacter sp.]|uniref:DUF2683 family protein n=1 Tax=Mucilaginibacter sp. L3T2-6 TaxID=3062491 RepID=UPI0026753B92|nr:DUF2683 family protein [Mucilaginibacter sp. L3T2-6]MDO3640693.1 hypothetical protein [Mucilaginibacter sp. L3T2-6]MDV6212967.1 hypothetical protein [Mucilaginibacter sp. L3T2-6]